MRNRVGGERVGEDFTRFHERDPSGVRMHEWVEGPSHALVVGVVDFDDCRSLGHCRVDELLADRTIASSRLLNSSLWSGFISCVHGERL